MPSEEKFRVRKDSWGPLFLRCAFGTLGIVANFWAIDRLALADSNILNKMSPFFAIIMSYFILREKPNRVERVSVLIASGFLASLGLCRCAQAFP